MSFWPGVLVGAGYVVGVLTSVRWLERVDPDETAVPRGFALGAPAVLIVALVWLLVYSGKKE